MDARPIITPSTPYLFLYSTAFSGLSMSPLPKTGIRIRGLFLTSAIKDQSASPLYICFLVRPCIEIASMPISCSLSAASTTFLVSSSQPKRVFTVTGNEVAFTISAVRRTILGIS